MITVIGKNGVQLTYNMNVEREREWKWDQCV